METKDQTPDTNPSASHVTSAAKSRLQYIAAIIIVLIIIGAGYYVLMVHGPSKPSALNSTQSTSLGKAPANYSNSYYLEKTQAEALFGSGGSYSSSQFSRTEVRSSGLANITSIYNVTYRSSNPAYTNFTEYVIVANTTNDASSLYSIVIKEFSIGNTGPLQSFGLSLNKSLLTSELANYPAKNLTVQFNDTEMGLDYSFASFSTNLSPFTRTNQSNPYTVVLFAGIKGREIVMLSVLTNSTSESFASLVNDTASQLP